MLDANDPQGSLIGVTLGSYRVTGRIGAGGMGIVYRAQDLRLERTVALKALPDSAGSDPGARRKLMDEARRGSRVVSPYAATVFDVVEQDERAYIVMEHIEGRRLDLVLREDRPDLDTVTGFAIEIAEALIAIHAAGLVHRDLKPANVMVSPAGHVKVMDFGLAREDAATFLRKAQRDSTLSTETRPGAVAGTILYMSPEQVLGDPLDARSDLFSFGSLLYEAVAGRHPFERESLLASASAILNDAPGGATEPPELATSTFAPIVHRLLEKDRERRYQSAESALQDLRAAKSGITPNVDTAPWPKRRRTSVFAAVAVVLAAIAAVGFALWPSRPPAGPPGARPVLAVLPFEDRTGEPRGDLRAQLLADLLATDLAGSSLVRALPSDRVREILLGGDARASQKAAVAAVSKAADVRWIVAGALYQEHDALYALIGVYRPGESEPSKSFRAAAGNTAGVAELAGVRLRQELFPNQKDAGAADRSVAVGGSTSEDAQLLEQEAKKDLRELRYGEAIEKLEKAVHLDPGFLTAQVRLADVLDRAGYAKRARDTADRTLRTVEQLGGAARRGSIVVEARAVHARIHGAADTEVAARRELIADRGDDPSPHVELARALDRRGRVTEALPEIALAIALDPKDPLAHLAKARMLYRAKRFDEATADLDRAETLLSGAGSIPGRAAVDRARGELEYFRAQYPRAEVFYRKASGALQAARFDFLAAQTRKLEGDCELMQGNLDAAVAIYEPVLVAARAAGDFRTIVSTLSSLGGQYIVRGRLDRAERVLREARDVASELGNPTLLAPPTLNLASVLDSTGRAAESRALAEEALALARDVGDRQVEAKALVNLATGQYREGRLDDAIRSYREIVDSAPLATAPGAPLGNAQLGLAEILRESGRLSEALDAAEQAVSVNRDAHQRVLLGFSLVARARIRADLALDADAAADLDEAQKLASDPAPPLQDLLRNVAAGRAAVAAARSRWDDAERKLVELRAGIGPEQDRWLDVTVLGLSARVAIERGRIQDAIRFAQKAISSPQGSPVERVRARVELARAQARAGDPADAASQARQALDKAAGMDASIVTALACAVLVELGGQADTESIRARGQAALERYLDAAPAARREALRSRDDVRIMSRRLEGHEAATPPR